MDEFGCVVRAKARLVAHGFAWREGVDFFETFCPCPSVNGIRVLAAFVCELGSCVILTQSRYSSSRSCRRLSSSAHLKIVILYAVKLCDWLGVLTAQSRHLARGITILFTA
ncbi:unnamed protein product [Pylaiella littoralis]